MKVLGTIKYNLGDAQGFKVDGELAEGGARYFGNCKTDKQGNLGFIVGTKRKVEATSATDFYLQITGVEGPPVEGAYAETDPVPVPKDGPSTDFAKAIFKNVNEYSFTQASAANSAQCRVDLYAVPVAGELDPNNSKFSHYFRLWCYTLDVAPSGTGSNLTWIEAEFWFANCR